MPLEGLAFFDFGDHACVLLRVLCVDGAHKIAQVAVGFGFCTYAGQRDGLARNGDFFCLVARILLRMSDMVMPRPE